MTAEHGIRNEKFLQPELILPVQFQGMWRSSRAVTPERALMVGVLWQTAQDLQKYRWTRRGKGQRLYRDAYRWVVSNDRTWPYSFVNICEALNLSPTYIRAELLGGADAAPAAA